ncbi:MAG: 4-hydroxy-2-oxopentanoic acid aldolase [Flavobacteriales bacterium]|nr:4-hydroxy-2-oxopentanoic acid aldolase [Flavobacteriales bacterium]
MTTLLDCTLRDGSYAIDFQFTEADTREISRRLDILGFEYIEVGHGVGIGASARIPAAATDEAYGEAAEAAVMRGKWGMFAIAGLATLHEIASMVNVGMKFVRIGIEPGQIKEYRDFLISVINLDVLVFVNLMKSYVLDPVDLAKAVVQLEDLGVSGIYLVDSAGGMLPDELKRYADVMVESRREQVLLGFHGHDNLGLSVAHSLSCRDVGFDVIDSTFQGIGRSSGNTPTERIVAALARTGEPVPDVADVCKASEELVRQRLPTAGTSGLDTFAGYARFHTSYMPDLISVAKRFHVDPYLLMQEHCAADLINADLFDLESRAADLATSGAHYTLSFPRDQYSAGDQ